MPGSRRSLIECCAAVGLAALLGLGEALVGDLLDCPFTPVEQTTPLATGRLRLSAGDRVVLTGTMRRGRAEITADAEARGLSMTGSVSRRTTVMVAADPDSLSGKARNARELGVPVVDEECFLSALAQMGH